MDRRAKVEPFEQIRREYEHGGGTIRGIAKKLGIHRRMVREAVLSAVPFFEIALARWKSAEDLGHFRLACGLKTQRAPGP